MITFRRGFYLRVALIADLWFYLVALVLLEILDLFPLAQDNTILASGPVLVAIFALVPAVLLFGRLVEKPKIPLNEWAYLVTAGYGLLILFGFYIVGYQSLAVTTNINVVVTAFVSVGVVGAIGAHLLDGGSNPIGPAVERRVEKSHDH